MIFRKKNWRNCWKNIGNINNLILKYNHGKRDEECFGES